MPNNGTGTGNPDPNNQHPPDQTPAGTEGAVGSEHTANSNDVWLPPTGNGATPAATPAGGGESAPGGGETQNPPNPPNNPPANTPPQNAGGETTQLGSGGKGIEQQQNLLGKYGNLLGGKGTASYPGTNGISGWIPGQYPNIPGIYHPNMTNPYGGGYNFTNQTTGTGGQHGAQGTGAFLFGQTQGDGGGLEQDAHASAYQQYRQSMSGGGTFGGGFSNNGGGGIGGIDQNLIGGHEQFECRMCERQTDTFGSWRCASCTKHIVCEKCADSGIIAHFGVPTDVENRELLCSPCAAKESRRENASAVRKLTGTLRACDLQSLLSKRQWVSKIIAADPSTLASAYSHLKRPTIPQFKIQNGQDALLGVEATLAAANNPGREKQELKQKMLLKKYRHWKWKGLLNSEGGPDALLNHLRAVIQHYESTDEFEVGRLVVALAEERIFVIQTLKLQTRLPPQELSVLLLNVLRNMSRTVKGSQDPLHLDDLSLLTTMYRETLQTSTLQSSFGIEVKQKIQHNGGTAVRINGTGGSGGKFTHQLRNPNPGANLQNKDSENALTRLEAILGARESAPGSLIQSLYTKADKQNRGAVANLFHQTNSCRNCASGGKSIKCIISHPTNQCEGSCNLACTMCRDGSKHWKKECPRSGGTGPPQKGGKFGKQRGAPYNPNVNPPPYGQQTYSPPGQQGQQSGQQQYVWTQTPYPPNTTDPTQLKLKDEDRERDGRRKN